MSMNGAASGSAMVATESATVPIRTAKILYAATGEARMRSRSERA